MKGLMAFLVPFFFAVTQLLRGSSLPLTAPAFLWSPHYQGVKEMINYRIISPEDLTKSVLSEAGWSHLLCSGENLQESVDIVLVFVGRKLQSPDISRSKHVDSALIDLLKDSFTRSNVSIAFPYVAVSKGKEAMEKSLISGFTENCGHGLGVNNLAFLESCFVEGEGYKKLASLRSVYDYVGSRMETRLKGQTDLIMFCNGGSQASEKFDQNYPEGKLFSEIISFLDLSGATYTVLYVSDPHRSLQYPSNQALDRFLAESTLGSGSSNSTDCDGVCQIKSSLLEGLLVGIVLLIILLSGLCCMMGIDTPTRFETFQES